MLLAAETALLVGDTGDAVALNLAGRSPERPSADTTRPSARQADDIPSARVAARLYGHRVEALSERTETSTTWADKDGSLTT
ncbi:hypothetical protein, partial [Streptomyces shenzhenensis]